MSTVEISGLANTVTISGEGNTIEITRVSPTPVVVNGTSPIAAAASGTTFTISHNAPAVGGTVTLYPSSVTVDATGHVTAVGSQQSPLTIASNLSDLGSVATARTNLGITNIGSYTGQIETAADKTYTIDPGAATARTITGFHIKSGAGTVTATLKNGSSTVKAASVSTSSGDQSSLANTSVSADAVVTIVMSSNSSATDVIFAVEYTE